MAGGRPTGEIVPLSTETISLFNKSPFKSEKHLCDFLENNLRKFCLEEFGVELESYVREANLGGSFLLMGYKAPRIDFMIILKDGRRIGIECKGSKRGLNEMVSSIGQILNYLLVAEQQGIPFSKILLVSGTFNNHIFSIVNKFHLPVDILYLSKEYRLKHHG